MANCCSDICEVAQVYNCDMHLDLLSEYTSKASVGHPCTNKVKEKMDVWSMGFWLLHDHLTAPSSTNNRDAFPWGVCSVSCDFMYALEEKLATNCK